MLITHSLTTCWVRLSGITLWVTPALKFMKTTSIRSCIPLLMIMHPYVTLNLCLILPVMIVSWNQQKQAAHASARTDKYSSRNVKFKKLIAQVIRCSRVKHHEYLNPIEEDIRRNSKSFWSYIKKLKKHPEIPQNMNYNSLHATDDVDISVNWFLTNFNQLTYRHFHTACTLLPLDHSFSITPLLNN